MAYTRLNHEEREQIMILDSQGIKPSAIAASLGRSVSTITREIQRHADASGHYSAQAAQNRAEQRARSHHLKRKIDHPALWRIIQEKLTLRWSPEQIAHYLRKTYPSDPLMAVSHETIYTYLYVQCRGQLKMELTRYLRQHRMKRRPRSPAAETRGKIPDMVSIRERPAEVADRTVPGHWEGDLVMGASNRTAMGTLVERTTRFAILVSLKKHDAPSTRMGFAEKMSRLPSHLRKSMTYDQGKEMAEHVQFTMDTEVQVYFADPHSPWMRGTNENTNGLIRDFFPKGTDFSKIRPQEIRWVQDALNERPRKTLGWLTPKEAFEALLEEQKNEKL